MRKHIHVTCAIVEHGGLVLATQRSASMSLPLKWEFPGGKIHLDETPEECLRRELIEELALEVTVGEKLCSSTHHYPDFTVTLYPFICAIECNQITLHEHANFIWLPPKDLHDLDWAQADLPVIASYLAACESTSK